MTEAEIMAAIEPYPVSLEAELDRELEFPVTLTLLLRLPETGSGGEPELFTFVFDEYSKPPSEGD